MDQIAYWLKGASERNFGDHLSEYLMSRLFLQIVRRPAEIRVIGSVLHDWFGGFFWPLVCGRANSGGDLEVREYLHYLAVTVPKWPNSGEFRIATS